jgi:hypothetical protein
VLVAQTLEDPSGRVPLFGRGLFVVGQDRFDGGQMAPEHGLSTDLGHLIAGRLGVGQDLGQGLVADPIVTVDGALRSALYQDLASDLGPLVHVGVHPSPVLLVRSGSKPGSGIEQIRGYSGAAVFDHVSTRSGAAVFDRDLQLGSPSAVLCVTPSCWPKKRTGCERPSSTEESETAPR